MTGDSFKKLSEEQKEILYLILEESLTPTQIAYRRQTSIRAVYKTIAKLRKKGLLKGTLTRGFTKRTLTMSLNSPQISQGSHQIRLHNQQFWAKLIYKSSSYMNLLKIKQFVKIEGYTICFWKDHIDIYSNDDFLGDSKEIAHSKSIESLFNLISLLEDRFGFLIVKGANTVIKEIRAHYAELNNELAQDINKKEEKLIIKAPEDEKGWFVIDKSLSGDEAECIHPSTSYEDIGKIVPMFQAIREGKLDLIETDKIARLALHTSATIVEKLGLGTSEEPRPRTTRQTSLQDFEPSRPDYFG